MKAYESGAAAYFATPPVNLIYAYHASLTSITKSSPSLPDRFKIHRQVSNQVKDAAAELGLKQVPLDPAYAANGMTAVRPYPHRTHDHTPTRSATRIPLFLLDPFSFLQCFFSSVCLSFPWLFLLPQGSLRFPCSW